MINLKKHSKFNFITLIRCSKTNFLEIKSKQGQVRQQAASVPSNKYTENRKLKFLILDCLCYYKGGGRFHTFS